MAKHRQARCWLNPDEGSYEYYQDDDCLGTVEQRDDLQYRWVALDYTKPLPTERAGCLVLGPFGTAVEAQSALESSVAA